MQASAAALLRSIADVLDGNHGRADVAAAMLLSIGVGAGAEDAVPRAAMAEAAQLVLKAVELQGIANCARLADAAGRDAPVERPGLIADGYDVDKLWIAGSIRPIFGACHYYGQDVFVVYPKVYTFDQLSEHLGLSEKEAKRLMFLTKRVMHHAQRAAMRRSQVQE